MRSIETRGHGAGWWWRVLTVSPMRCLTLLASAAIGSVAAGSEGELLWRLWKSEHGRVYSGAVDAERFAVFEENRRFINAHNARGDSSVVLGTNQ